MRFSKPHLEYLAFASAWRADGDGACRWMLRLRAHPVVFFKVV